MKLIKTDEIQEINKRLDQSDIVYFFIGQERRSGIQNGPQTIPTVEIDIHMMRLDLEQRIKRKTIEDENGVKSRIDVIMIHPQLIQFDMETAKFKRSTFETALGNPVLENYETIFQSQLTYLKDKWNNNGWTGTEIQKTKYWDLGGDQVTILSEEQVVQLLTPYELES